MLYARTGDLCSLGGVSRRRLISNNTRVDARKEESSRSIIYMGRPTIVNKDNDVKLY